MNTKNKVVVSAGYRDIDEITVYIARVNCEHQYIPGIYSADRLNMVLKTHKPTVRIYRTGIRLTYSL